MKLHRFAEPPGAVLPLTCLPRHHSPFTAFRRTTTMKRARNQSSTIVDTGIHHAVVAPARAAASPAVVLDGGVRVSETTSKPTLLPPPPIQPFSDDSDDARPAGDASSSSSSSSSSAGGSAAEERRRKRAKREPQQELEGWRAAANAILSAGVKEDGAGSRSSKGESSGSSRKSFAVVCSSNVNRSIMAEILLKEHGMRAQSYGTGREVRLPGKDSKSPQSFPFGTPYVEIRDFLARQNEALFRRNSVLGLLERNSTTKRAPERWQSLDGEHVASFDVVVCFESRVFDLVVEDLQQRDPDTFKPLHVVSMTIRDSADDSAAAAGDVLDLCKMVNERAEWRWWLVAWLLFVRVCLQKGHSGWGELLDGGPKLQNEAAQVGAVGSVYLNVVWVAQKTLSKEGLEHFDNPTMSRVVPQSVVGDDVLVEFYRPSDIVQNVHGEIRRWYSLTRGCYQPSKMSHYCWSFSALHTAHRTLLAYMYRSLASLGTLVQLLLSVLASDMGTCS
ncbi:unnamed protein product [Ectocarpus sp. 4 AP-2014]